MHRKLKKQEKIIINKPKFNIIIFLLIFVFFISGCSRDKNTDSRDWEKDVLQASECGFDGLACCVNQEPTCLYGQTCCPHPLDPAKTHCFEDCSCGQADKFCCAGEDPCGQDLICFEGFCAECGGLEERCCDNLACEAGLACKQGQCVSCGLAGNPCCPDAPKCQKLEDKTKFLECKSGFCSYCGSGGFNACQTEPFCLENNLLNNGICYSCGGNSEPCCAGEEGGACREGLDCELGFCS